MRAGGCGAGCSGGIEVHEYRGAMMHAKVLIVDGEWAVLGTTNMDNRSFEHNDEVSLAMRDTDVAARLLDDYRRDVDESDEITLRPGRRDRLGKTSRAVHLDPGAAAVGGATSRCRSGRRRVDLRIATYNIHESRGMDRRISTGADCGSAPENRRRYRGAAGGGRRGAVGFGSGRGDRRGARYGLGDGAGPASSGISLAT